MNKNILIKFFTLFLILFGSIHETFATHGIGGEITVEHVINNFYRVSLSLYRDCGGISLGATQNISVSPVNSGSMITLNRVSITDITSVCATQVTNCTNASSTISGVEEHLYQVIFNFNPLPSNSPGYTLTWNGCCRSNAISNILNPGNQSTSLSTQFYRDVFAAPDNTPNFLIPPVTQYCLGQTSTTAINAIDADGDVLRYKLVDATLSGGASVPYAGSFSGVNPLPSSTPILIDSLTGLITFTPSATGRYVVNIQATEFRAGVEIGYIRREVEMLVTSCGLNNIPTIQAIPNAVVNDGTTFCTQVVATDLNNDTMSLNSFSSIAPPATFVVDSVVPGATYGTFCFTPTIADRGQTFTVSFLTNDNLCPTPGSSSTSFNITVPDICSLGLSTTVIPSSVTQNTGAATASITNGIAPYSYSWSGPNNFVANGDSISDLAAGTYYLSATDGNNCAVLDTLIVTLNSTLAVRFTEINAVAVEDFVRIDFETMEELDIDMFFVERSLNGVDYEPIAQIDPKGFGHYQYVDNWVEARRYYYYRIKEKSNAGTNSYSKTVRVQTNGSSLIKIVPTYLKGNTLTVSGMPHFVSTHLIITDLAGRKLHSSVIRGRQIQVPKLQTGHYIIFITQSDRILSKHRIFVE